MRGSREPVRRLHAPLGRLRAVGIVPGRRRIGWVSWVLQADGWRALTPYVERGPDGARRMIRVEPRRPEDLAHEIGRWAALRPMTVSPITRVTGGVAGLAATYAAVRALADRFDAAGDHLRDRAAADARVLAEPDLLESAPLSPVTFAEAEARVLDASAGIHGALEASVTYEADALLVRATVTAYEECDRLVASSFEVLDYAVGRDVGYAVAAAAPSLLLLGLAAGPTWDHLPAGARRRLGDTVQGWAEEHPEAVQHGVDATGGLLDGLLAGLPAGLPVVSWLAGFAAFHPTAGDAAADLAALYPNDGPPAVRRRHDLAVPLADVPPRDLTGLIRHLDQVSLLSPPDRPGDAGTIEVQTLDAPDGTVRHVVYLPGTDDLLQPRGSTTETSATCRATCTRSPASTRRTPRGSSRR